MTLTEFLLARIAEDEAVALRITPGRNAENGHWDANSIEFHNAHDRPTTKHIIRHDPARVLAECEAKRAIIAFHESWPTLAQTPARFEHDESDLDNYTYRMSQEIAWLTTREYVARFGIDPPTAPILALLALPYVDHPDYLPEWKP